tara:strand:+ start:698 stop:970 length:273 start_codon:yes stop_codon:yes gene_type:complete
LDFSALVDFKSSLLFKMISNNTSKLLAQFQGVPTFSEEQIGKCWARSVYCAKAQGNVVRTYYRFQERAYVVEQRSDTGFIVAARRLVKLG